MTQDLKLISKMYDGAGHRYMYGLNKDIPEEEFEKAKPFMKDYRRKDFEDGTVKVTGRPDGWMCTREDAPKVEEALGITDTLEKREKEIEELLSNPETKQATKDKAMNELEKNRFLVPQGLTCIWQVSGRANKSFAEQLNMDLKYVMKRGFFYDLWLIIKTIPAVLFGKGAE